MEMWFGVEPLLSLLVLSLPVVWIIDWRFSSKSSSMNSSKYLSYFLLFLIILIVFQAVLGHLETPSHLHAVYWGISDSIFLAALNFSNGPEGRLLLIALFYWIYIIIRYKSTNLPVTICSLFLIPLIAIGASAGSFESVTESIVSPYAPTPTIYPLLLSLITGILLGEGMIRSIPLFSISKLTLLQTRSTIALWVSIAGIMYFADQISSLPPSGNVISLIFLISTTIVADILGGISESSPESNRETWPSLAFTVFCIGIVLLLIIMNFEGITLSGIGIMSIVAALGAQLPSLGFDTRNRSSHRGIILGASTGSCVLVIFSSLNEPSIFVLGLLFMLIPQCWNVIDRQFWKS